MYGINSDINCIDKIIDFLKKETKGYKVIIAGHSSAAYLTLILSISIPNVIRALSFGPIFDISSLIDRKLEYANELISFYSNYHDGIREKWFNLISFLKNKNFENLLYFYANDCDLDLSQHKIGKTLGIKYIGINSKVHCGVFDYNVLIRLLTLNDKKFNNAISKNKFKENVSLNKLLITLSNIFVFIFIKVKKKIFLFFNFKK